jgi:ATP-binding cassette subfamily A (ABC1) protein 3
LNELFGYCPQFDAIFEHLTVYENLEFFASIKGIKHTLIKKLVNTMIREMSLDEFTNKISGKLSEGNKRKLAVAISMIGNPPIILLDEPSTGMDPEARRFMWSVIHKISTKGKKSSVIMTTHSMDEAETLCKRMGIMVNGEFVCLGKANEIKERYGYGYEIDVRIKPLSQIDQEEILEKNNLEKNLLINKDNVESILNSLGKNYFKEELKEGRLGSRINKSLNLNSGVSIGVLLNWIFFVENAIKFIQKGKDYFEEIILAEYIENNFLFKMKKGNNTKSIGFFFGLFEESKEECNVTEYSIQQTSLEQIFNKFASNQGKVNNEIEQEKMLVENKNIIIDDALFNNLLN